MYFSTNKKSRFAKKYRGRSTREFKVDRSTCIYRKSRTDLSYPFLTKIIFGIKNVPSYHLRVRNYKLWVTLSHLFKNFITLIILFNHPKFNEIQQKEHILCVQGYYWTQPRHIFFTCGRFYDEINYIKILPSTLLLHFARLHG